MAAENHAKSAVCPDISAHRSVGRSQELTLSLSARLLLAQDEERRRISRELHDSVGQSLVAVLMNLETLSKRQGDETLDETISLVKDTLLEVRTVSYLMHPPMLDLFGLEKTLRWYAEGFSRRSEIQTQVDIPQPLPRLASEKETVLYRIVQECLTNIHRYAGASKAWIRIRVTEDRISLEVEDNGKGLATPHIEDNPDTQISLGVGIAGMRERVREVGGSFVIHSGKFGTKVTATITFIRKAKAL